MHIELPFHIRPTQQHARWSGPPVDTWRVARAAVHQLLTRWRPERVVVQRTRYDEWNQPESMGDYRWFNIEDFDADAISNVSEVTASGPMQVRVLLPSEQDMPNELWFVDPDHHRRLGALDSARAVAGHTSAWLTPKVDVQRGFSLHISELGKMQVQWDVGPLQAASDPSAWKRADAALDATIAAALTDLGFVLERPAA